MKRLIGVLIVILLVAMPTGAIAVQGGGDARVAAALALNFGFGAGVTATQILVQTNLGYFITAEHEVGFTLLGSAVRAEFETGATATASVVAFEGNYKYNIPTGTIFVPYVGPQAGAVIVQSNGFTKTVASFGGFGGVNVFLTEKVSLFGELNFRRFTVEDVDFNVVSTLVGISYFFRLGR